MSTMMHLREFVQSKHRVKGTAHETEMCAGLGLLGEIGEFADLIKKEDYHGKPCEPERKLDELGDILFYFQSFGGLSATELDETFGRDSELEILIQRIPIQVTKVLARAGSEKKWRFMCCLEMTAFAAKWVECAEQEIGERWYREPAMRHAIGYFAAMVQRLGFSMEQVFQTNVRKLNRRYPNGFDPARAHAHGEDTDSLAYSRELNDVKNEFCVCGHNRTIHRPDGKCAIAGCSCGKYVSNVPPSAPPAPPPIGR